MAKTATITVRVEPELKKKAEETFAQLGLTTSEAIVLFLKQVEFHRGLPFAVKIPNRVTRRAIEDAEARRGLKTFESVEDLVQEWEAD